MDDFLFCTHTVTGVLDQFPDELTGGILDQKLFAVQGERQQL